jgi:hypothetical protein
VYLQQQYQAENRHLRDDLVGELEMIYEQDWMSLSDEQLEETLPGAPWADGTIGGVLSANAGHGRMHWGWAKEAGLLEH